MINKDKMTRWIALSVFWAMVVYMCMYQARGILEHINNETSYKYFYFGDWLINYEGGFVRRGLFGQILHIIYNLHPYPVADVIIVIYYLSFVAFTILLVRLLQKNGVSLFILPFSICLFFGMVTSIVGGRRDYVMFILMYYIYKDYFALLSNWQTKRLVRFLILSALMILSHEASFFFTFPILMVHYLVYGTTTPSRITSLKESVIWLLPLTLMMLVCICKGNADIPYKIWDSWNDCLHRYPLNGETEISYGPLFLARNLPDTIQMHLNHTWPFPSGIATILLNLYVLIATYYFATNANTIKLGNYAMRSIDSVRLSNIMLVQFVALLPMFGFLSCDFGRVVAYWVISSLVFYCLQTGNQSAPSRHTCIVKQLNQSSTLLQNGIKRCRFLHHPLVYLLLLISVPIMPYSGSSIFASFPFIPYSVKLALWNWIRSVV